MSTHSPPRAVRLGLGTIMSDEYPPVDDPQPDPERPVSQSQEIQHSQVSAIVPEQVAQGCFSTGAVVLQGAHEFIIDFLLRMGSPHQVAARVVLPPGVLPRLITALRENIKKYESRHGVIPTQSVAQQMKSQPSPQELYEQLKLKDAVVSGSYANAVMIGHTATEFSFDFITTFFPRSAVSQRVFLAAPNVPRLLDSLVQSFDQFRQRAVDAPPDGNSGVPQPPPADEDSGTHPPEDV